MAGNNYAVQIPSQVIAKITVNTTEEKFQDNLFF